MRAPPSAAPAVPPLSTLEPYVVLFTTLAGIASLTGILVENVPALVATCWFLFLARASRYKLKSGPLPFVPAIAAGIAGGILAVSSVSTLDVRMGVFAMVSAGIAWLLLPDHGPMALGNAVRRSQT